jgi:CHAT domain-containing protein
MFGFREILRLNLAGLEWLVLAGCDTAAAHFDTPSLSLADAFLAAGTGRVVASLWLSDNLATILLLGELHRLLKDQHSSPRNSRPLLCQALRDAKRWLCDLSLQQVVDEIDSRFSDSPEKRTAIQTIPSCEKPFSHPFFWAAFQVYG